MLKLLIALIDSYNELHRMHDLNVGTHRAMETSSMKMSGFLFNNVSFTWQITHAKETIRHRKIGTCACVVLQTSVWEHCDKNIIQNTNMTLFLNPQNVINLE